MKKKDLILYGYTGSIGRQALEVLRNPKCPYRLIAIVSKSHTTNLDVILKDFKSITSIGIVQGNISYQTDKKIYQGEDVLNIIEDNPGAVVLNAISGLEGIKVTLKAINFNRRLLLANKESIVVGYKLVKEALNNHKNSVIIPIDSEHSALYKLLKYKEKVEELIITCSGGALRDFSLKDVEKADFKAVSNHPTWSMGPKITIDCATLANKAYEVIEAMFFFNFPLEKIKVLMHDESLIHAMVRLKDNSFIAEMGSNDMRIPLSYALNNCKRVEGNFKNFELTDLHFRKFDKKRYPLFEFILNSFDLNTSALATINAADEIAVEAFINDEIMFKDIYTIIVKTFNSVRQIDVACLDDLLHVVNEAKQTALLIKEEIRKDK